MFPDRRWSAGWRAHATGAAATWQGSGERSRRTLRGGAAFVLGLLAGAPVALAQAPPSQGQLRAIWPACPTVAVEAAELDCVSDACLLDGGVRLRCPDALLAGQRLELAFDRDGTVTEVALAGPALIVSGPLVTTCRAAELGAGGMLERLRGARLRFKRSPAPGLLLTLGQHAIMAGSNRADLAGDVTQVGERRYDVDEPFFTLCDCGRDPPSWWVSASSAEVELDERVWLYHPVVHLSPTPAGSLPVFWLPLMTYPLKDRAVGLLAPRIQSFRSAWPALDLPFFVPLGESWDVTLVPGYFPYRGPRAGLEARWAPLAGTRGELRLAYTADLAGGAAEAFAVELVKDSGDMTPDPRRALLTHRLQLELQHRTSLDDGRFQLVAQGRLAGDDFYLLDFGSLTQAMVTSYLPSRLAALQQLGPLVASLGADVYQDLRPAAVGAPFPGFGACLPTGSLAGQPVCDRSYSFERALGTVARLPELELRLQPVSVGPLVLAGQAGTLWYAPLRGFGQQALGLLHGAATVASGLQALGVPLAVEAGYSYLRTVSGPRQQDFLHFGHVAATSRGVLGRAYELAPAEDGTPRQLLHLVGAGARWLLIPAVGGQGMVTPLWPAVDGLDAATDPLAAERLLPVLEERLQVAPAHQLLLGLDTTVEAPALGPLGALRATVELTQGFNLGGLAGVGDGASDGPGTIAGSGRPVGAGLGQARGQATLALGRLALRGGLVWGWVEDAPMELSGGGSLRLWGRSSLSVNYIHLYGGSERLLTGLRELLPGGALPPLLAGGETHDLALGLAIGLGSAWTLRGTTTYMGRLDYRGLDAAAAAAENLKRKRPGFSQHTLGVSYSSPCQCWGFTFLTIVPQQFVLGDFSEQYWPNFRFLIDLAGMTLGAGTG